MAATVRGVGSARSGAGAAVAVAVAIAVAVAGSGTADATAGSRVAARTGLATGSGARPAGSIPPGSAGNGSGAADGIAGPGTRGAERSRASDSGLCGSVASSSDTGIATGVTAAGCRIVIGGAAAGERLALAAAGISRRVSTASNFAWAGSGTTADAGTRSPTCMSAGDRAGAGISGRCDGGGASAAESPFDATDVGTGVVPGRVEASSGRDRFCRVGRRDETGAAPLGTTATSCTTVCTTGWTGIVGACATGAMACGVGSGADVIV